MRLGNLLVIGLAILCMATPARAQNRRFFGGGVGLFNPIVDTVSTGARMVVSPTVSADRKYVTISGQFQNAQLLSIQNFPFFQINQNGAGGIVGGAVPAFGGASRGGQG